MELLKKLFRDDDKIVGLCAFRKKTEEKIYSFEPQFKATRLIYTTNTKNNFFLL